MADLNHKDHPNELFIEDALDDDNSVVRLSSKTMDKLELFCGDAVKLKGKKRRETICIALSDDTCQDDRIRVNYVIQKNLRVHSGDVITIQGCQDVKYGKRIHVLPIDDTVKGIGDNLLQDYLQPYFLDSYRPVCVDDTFIVRMETRAVEFKVIETEPSPYCIVAPETVIDCEGEPIKREVKEIFIDEIDFDNIDGLEDTKRTLKKLIQCSIEHPKIYNKFGMAPSHGVLLYGPPGCGKIMLAKALANEYNVKFISIKCCELLAMSLDNTENNVRKVFDDARRAAPCVLFIDKLDCLCSWRSDNDVTSEHLSAGGLATDRLVNQMLTEIDGISIRTKIFIIGTANRPDMVDPTLLNPGRLDQTIYVPLPDEKARHDILKIALRKWPVAKDVDLTFLARALAGFSGADIAEFCRRACAAATKESIENKHKMERSNSHNDLNTADPMAEIRQEHFEKAIKFPRCCPSSDHDIHKCEMFAQMRQRYYGYDLSFLTFKYPQNINDGDGVNQGSTGYTEDDDLYG